MDEPNNADTLPVLDTGPASKPKRRFRFGLRTMFVMVAVAAVTLGSWLYVKRMEKIHWRQLTRANFTESEVAGRLILFEYAEMAMWTRYSSGNKDDDFMFSTKCGWKTNWNGVDCYRLDLAAGLTPAEKADQEWVKQWIMATLGESTNESVTQVVIYDPSRKATTLVPDRDSQTVNRIIGECLLRRKVR